MKQQMRTEILNTTRKLTKTTQKYGTIQMSKYLKAQQKPKEKKEETSRNRWSTQVTAFMRKLSVIYLYSSTEIEMHSSYGEQLQLTI